MSDKYIYVCVYIKIRTVWALQVAQWQSIRLPMLETWV